MFNSIGIYSQIGINTTTPSAMLEVLNPTLNTSTKQSSIKAELPDISIRPNINNSGFTNKKVLIDSNGNFYQTTVEGNTANYFSNTFGPISSSYVTLVSNVNEMSNFDFFTNFALPPGSTGILYGSIYASNINGTQNISVVFSGYNINTSNITVTNNNTSEVTINRDGTGIFNFRLTSSGTLQAKKFSTTTSVTDILIYLDGVIRN